jgi:hypothetical protein
MAIISIVNGIYTPTTITGPATECGAVDDFNRHKTKPPFCHSQVPKNGGFEGKWDMENPLFFMFAYTCSKWKPKPTVDLPDPNLKNCLLKSCCLVQGIIE